MATHNVVPCEQYIGFTRRKYFSAEKQNKFPTGKVVSFVVLALFCILWMAPFVLLIATSGRSPMDGRLEPQVIFGTKSGWSWENYQILFTGVIPEGMGSASSPAPVRVFRWTLNSCISAIGGTALYLFVACLAAYAFTFLDFKYRNVIFTVLVMSMVVPGAATTVANQATVYNWGLNKSLLALIIPGLGGVYGMYLIKTFFTSIPNDLVESAKMDGYNHFQIFYKIILPQGKTVILIQGLFGFMGGWNDLIWPQMLYGSNTKDTSLWTIQVGMAYLETYFKGANSIGFSCAAGVVCILPVLIVYLIAQKYIIEGMASSGIKR